MAAVTNQVIESEWVALPGGELEGRRPKSLCGPCRVRRAAGAPSKAICFECYRSDRKRQSALNLALKAAGEFESTSEARFQDGLPFKPVNIARLEGLKAARCQARAGVPPYIDKRRQAQIAARHALQQIGDRLRAQAMHAAELQLPEAWLPFVASR